VLDDPARGGASIRRGVVDSRECPGTVPARRV
jgi:hypothetical protein